MFAVVTMRRKKQQSNENGNTMARAQVKLAIAGGVTSFAMFFFLIYGVLATMISTSGVFGGAISVLYQFVLAFFNNCNPYLLLICSKPLRSKFLETYHLKKSEKFKTRIVPMQSSKALASSKKPSTRPVTIQ